MVKILTERQYNAVMERVEELLKIVDDNTPADNKDSVELVLLSNLVADYEDEHYPITNPSSNKVVINIDWVPNNYGAAPENEDIACVSTGKTLEEVKQNILEAIEFHIEGMLADGEPVPEEFSGEWEPIFKLSTRAQLKYTGRYITRKALARETGIAEQQLSHYANGQRHPRPAMQERITNGIRAIASHLAVIL